RQFRELNEERPHQRADETLRRIANKNFEAIFKVPSAPGALESLVASPYVGDLISMETASGWGIALYRLNMFVQFVEQRRGYSSNTRTSWRVSSSAIRDSLTSGGFS